VTGKTAELRKHSPGPGTPLTGFELADKIDAATENLLKLQPNNPTHTDKATRLRADIKAWMKELPEAMARDRGDNLPTQKEREKLERAIGLRATNSTKAKQEVSKMCETALRSMIAFTDDNLKSAAEIDTVMADLNKYAEDNETFRKLLSEKMGTDLKKGFVGAVGKDYKDLLAVFEGGNMIEQMAHLVNFGRWFADKVFNTHKLRKPLSKIKEDAAFIENIMIQRREKLAAYKKAGHSPEKKLFADSEEKGTHTEGYAEGKAKSRGRDAGGQFTEAEDLDRKIPMEELARLTVDELKTMCRSMGLKVGGLKDELIARIRKEQKKSVGKRGAAIPGSTGKGDTNPHGRAKPDEAADRFVELSEREAKDTSDRLEGWIVNIVNPHHDWLREAKGDLAMPIKSGISGTTYRMMHMADQLGADTPWVRIALMGYLMPSNMHSYHEICASAKAHVPYTAGAYYPIPPWRKRDIEKMAVDAQLDPATKDVVIYGGKIPSSE